MSNNTRKQKDHCLVSGILTMKEGKGFKTIFNDVKTAQSYKDMFIWILKNDKFDVDIRLGYYDDKERIRSYYGFYSSSTLFIVL